MSVERVVVREPVTTTVERAGPTVEVSTPGVQGNPGPASTVPGPAGPTGATGATGPEGPAGTAGGLRMMEQNYALPENPWIHEHNLNTFAIEVNTYDPDGSTEKEGVVTFPDANTVRVDWYNPEPGVLRLLY